MSCRCAPGLSGMGDYRMNGVQVSSFLLRHPVVAANVAQTKLAIASGLYDWNYNPATEWRVPGTIPPWGVQVFDSVYKTVTIFPARDGNFYYTAETGTDLHTDKPDYTSPAGPCPEGYADVAGLCIPKPPSATSIGMFLLAGVAIYAYMNRR